MKPEVQVSDFRINSIPLAAALGTMGVPLWPELSVVVGGKSDFSESRKREWIQYDGAHPCPGGFRDQNNTLLAKVSASQIISWHRRGFLEQWAPNHVFYGMISANVNRARLLEHLRKAAPMESHMVLPADLETIPEHHGAAHFQLFPTEKSHPASEQHTIDVHDFDIAVALITIGFRFDGSKTEVRQADHQTTFRLWFETASGPGPIGPFIDHTRGLDRGTSATWDQFVFAWRYLKNRKHLRAALDSSPAQIICTVPDSFLQYNPKARNRVAQVREESLDREEEDIIKFFGRKKKHY